MEKQPLRTLPMRDTEATRERFLDFSKNLGVIPRSWGDPSEGVCMTVEAYTKWGVQQMWADLGVILLRECAWLQTHVPRWGGQQIWL